MDELCRHATAWRDSQTVREYIEAIKEALVAKDGMLPEDGEAAAYLQWAAQQADRLDPLVQNPCSVLDEST